MTHRPVSGATVFPTLPGFVVDRRDLNADPARSVILARSGQLHTTALRRHAPWLLPPLSCSHCLKHGRRHTGSPCRVPDGGPTPLRTFHSEATDAPAGARNVFTTPQRHASVFHSVLVRLGAKRVGATSSTSLAACLAHVACLAVGLPRRRLARWLSWSLSKQLATPCAWPGGHAHTLGRHHRPLPVAPARIEAGHHMLRPVPIAPSEACCRITLLGSHHLRSSLPHTLRALQTQLQTHPRAQLHCQARPANTANVRAKLWESSTETIHPVQCR